MNCLLDTHALLWSIFSPERLSRKAVEIISRPESTVFVSVVSFWEISIKFASGRLELSGARPEELPGAATGMGFAILPLDAEEAASCHRLPRTAHRDPFDRLIVWQAIEKELVLITRDRDLTEYRDVGLKIAW